MSELPLDAPRRFTSPIYGESGYARRKNDAYYTEHWVTEALCDLVRFRGEILEPAAGAGDMVAVLQKRGYRVYANDIDTDSGWLPIDFLTVHHPLDSIESIATNPPYGRVGAEFARHALALMKPVDGVVALLARHEWDSADGRRDIFADCPAFALKITLTRRPSWDWWEPPEKRGDSSPRHNFAWYVWNWRHRGRPEIAYAPVAREPAA